jgi:hypothetical protein
VVPSALSTDARISLFGLQATLAGWGLINTQRIPMKLRTARVTVITDADCIEMFERLTNTRSHFALGDLCTAANPFVLIDRVIVLS